MLRSLKKHKKQTGRVGLAVDGVHAGIAVVERVADGKPILRAQNFEVASERDGASTDVIDIAALKVKQLPLSKVLGNATYQLQLVETPNVPEEELRQALRWRVKELVDYPVDEALIDLFEVPSHANPGSKSIAYAVVCHEPGVQEQVVLPRSLGIHTMDVIDIPELCLRNIAARLPGDQHGTALLHFTNECGYLTITRKGVLHLIRRIETGRNVLAENADDEFFISERAAGISLEVQRSLDYYESHYDCSPISELILGPGEGLDALPKGLNENLGLAVKRLDLDDMFDIEGELTEKQRGECLLAIGAAIRPADDDAETQQLVNLLEPEEKLAAREFPARFIALATAAMILLMCGITLYAGSRVSSLDDELALAAQQETAAVERLTNVRATLDSVVGTKSWAERVEDALAELRERQSVLALVQGSSLGETRGFSRHLRALASQDIDGIWLTHIGLSAEGDQTRLEGWTRRAELVPSYVQDLIAKAPFAKQRFHQFQIDNPVDNDSNALLFTMDSRVLDDAMQGGSKR